MYCTQRGDGYGDFASFSMNDGFLVFRFDTGSGEVTLRSANKLIPGEWYHIKLGRRMKEGHLIINNGTKKWIEGGLNQTLSKTQSKNIRK